MWTRTTDYKPAFNTLKHAVTKEPVLTLLDFIKLFEVDVETFDIAVGGILMQDDHPFAYRSYKLSGVEKR